MDELDQAILDLNSLELEQANLRTEIRNLEARLTALRARGKELHSDYYGGLISAQKAKVSRLQREQLLAKLPRLPLSDGSLSNTYVITRTTPRRVYYDSIKGGDESYFSKAKDPWTVFDHSKDGKLGYIEVNKNLILNS